MTGVRRVEHDGSDMRLQQKVKPGVITILEQLKGAQHKSGGEVKVALKRVMHGRCAVIDYEIEYERAEYD